MNTNRNNLISICVIFILIASVNCNQNDIIKLLQPVVSPANGSWFVKVGDANVTVSDISQNWTDPSERSAASHKSAQTEKYDSDDIYLNTAEIATKYGYKVREHFPITKDNYKLTLFQISTSKGSGKNPVIFLMHDLFGSSDDFVITGPKKSLAFMLADAGFDVWLGNARGNKYSRENKFLDPDTKAFWEFSWHDIGIYDLPAMVDHALMETQADQLTYIGHGQGTTVFYVLTSEKPKYNRKFNLMISLGTIAWLWHIRSPVIRALEPVTDAQFQMLEQLGNYEIFPASKSSKYCCTSKVAILICKTRLFTIFGKDYDQIDFEYACQQLTHFPSGASLRQLQHYIQLIRSRKFAQFDYGKQKNLATYGSKYPPSYDVEKITVPVVIYYADNDLVSTLDDTAILMQRLKYVEKYRVPHTNFNHRDFLLAKNVDQLLYFEMIDIINEKLSQCDEKGGKCYDKD